MGIYFSIHTNYRQLVNDLFIKTGTKLIELTGSKPEILIPNLKISRKISLENNWFYELKGLGDESLIGEINGWATRWEDWRERNGSPIERVDLRSSSISNISNWINHNISFDGREICGEIKRYVGAGFERREYRLNYSNGETIGEQHILHTLIKSEFSFLRKT